MITACLGGRISERNGKGGTSKSGVVIRYSNTFDNAASTTGRPESDSGGYKIYKFTGSGSITF